MHTIEPFFGWLDEYDSQKDERSPFFDRQYSEFDYSQTIYNFYIHPRWDNFGSSTLLLKVLYANYDSGYAILEMIGEWNDTLHNDIMFLKRDVIDLLMQEGINRFILIGENVLNFHFSEDDYYAEWAEDAGLDGWIVALNFNDHVIQEMRENQLHHHIAMSERYNNILWRKLKPHILCDTIDRLMMRSIGG